MKRIVLSSIIGIIFISTAFSQVVTESTIRKFNIGIGAFTDIWQGQPPEMSTRTINQGAQVFGMYNYQIKESAVYLAGGIGMGMHNLYSNTYIPDIKADSISFEKIPDGVSYKKSKISLTYVDVPIEFRIRTKKYFRIAFGFKVGFLINSHTKYKGNRFHFDKDGLLVSDRVNVVEKERDIKQIETWRYGPTFRIGYKWFNITVYYQLSQIFKVDKGPKLYPISIGIAVIPF
jgi:hypothetical protein